MPDSDPSTAHRDLYAALFRPRSVAVIGASDDVAKTSGRPVTFLRRAGFAGRIYPVNSRRDEVQGERAWPSIAALPEVPDHAYIVAPTGAVIAAVEECARAGVAVVTILASGFSEAGEQGLERDRQLRDIVRRTGIRLVGPSSLGLVNASTRLILSANAAFAEPDMPRGNIFVASQSGSMIGALVSRGKERGIGFAGLVSVGNEVDLSIGEICACTLDDPEVGGYMLFLETLRGSAALRIFARHAAARGKPVIAYKLGRSAVAAGLAVSHTGALAGEDDVTDAFFRHCGIARVETLEALIEGMPLLLRVPPRSLPSGPRTVGVVTTTGGGAAMVVDQLGIRGVTVVKPSPQTFARLAAAGVAVADGAIVDLTLAGTRYAVMKTALDVMLSAPEYDLVVAVVGSSARYHPDLAVRPIIDCIGAEKPLAAFLVPEAPAALKMLTDAGVPNFRTPEACADAIAAAFARRVPAPAPSVAAIASVPETAPQMLDELQAYALLDRLGVPYAPAVAVTAQSSAASLAGLPYPAVVKVLSADLAHKTEVGGVLLDILDAAQLTAAMSRIRATVAERLPGMVADRFLVQQMVDGLGEVLIGYRVDPQVGATVMLAAGGVFTEIYRDRSLRMAPVDLDTAMEMVGEVKALQALAGFRGNPAGDLEGVAHALVALSQLALLPDLHVLEAEINPLLVLAAGSGVVAVDALVPLG